MELTESEKKKIKDKLVVVSGILSEVYNLIRCRDEKGESELAVHVDSAYNDIDDTIGMVETV